MKIRLIKAIAILGLAGLAGQASADHMSGDAHPGDNMADFSWHINGKGQLIILVGNSSTGSAAVSAMSFDLNGGSIAGMNDVDGTGHDKNWRYSHNSGAYTHKFSGKRTSGVQSLGKGKFRFVGDFAGLDRISNVRVRFHRAKSDGMGKIDYGRGCLSGCASSKPVKYVADKDYNEVPEPGMLVLFGTGLMGVGLVWRRRQRAIA
ncbi:MAG: PEP-CTERM sorting domain-containing protein [Gammaproteobacteria bacterium]|nr:PEP-CTERM sorting domain-containing protein [Gammaproteobacteria bacterium]